MSDDAVTRSSIQLQYDPMVQKAKQKLLGYQTRMLTLHKAIATGLGISLTSAFIAGLAAIFVVSTNPFFIATSILAVTALLCVGLVNFLTERTKKKALNQCTAITKGEESNQKAERLAEQLKDNPNQGRDKKKPNTLAKQAWRFINTPTGHRMLFGALVFITLMTMCFSGIGGLFIGGAFCTLFAYGLYKSKTSKIDASLVRKVVTFLNITEYNELVTELLPKSKERGAHQEFTITAHRTNDGTNDDTNHNSITATAVRVQASDAAASTEERCDEPLLTSNASKQATGPTRVPLVQQKEPSGGYRFIPGASFWGLPSEHTEQMEFTIDPLPSPTSSWPVENPVS